MINVIYDHQIFWWQQHGGISRYFYELAKRVGSAEDFTASVVAPLYVNKYLREGGVNVSGIPVPAIPKTRRIMAMANRSAAAMLLKLFRPTLVHETFFQATSRAPRNCPVVLTVFDMIHEKFVSASDPITVEKRNAVQRADQVICISDSTRRDLLEMFNADPAKVRTIHLGHSFHSSAAQGARSARKKPFFLYVGMRAGYKNFDRLLRAYAASRKLHSAFDLYAFGDAAFTRAERESIRAAGLREDQVKQFSGDDEQLRYFYASAFALVYPSLYEGFGIPPLEAMSLGCPVLCSNVSSIPEVVGDASLYFDPTSTDEIRDAMERLTESADTRTDLISRGERRAKLFSYDQCAAKTMDVYREMV